MKSIFTLRHEGFHVEMDLEDIVSVMGKRLRLGDVVVNFLNAMGPANIFMREKALRYVGIDTREVRVCETDVFLMATGLAPHPAMTRVGGVPYSSRTWVWPTYEGQPRRFLGQVCFRDSQDLVPILPGDLLRVFVSHEFDDRPIGEQVYFEWDAIDDMTRGEGVESGKGIVDSAARGGPEYYGVRVRCVDCMREIEQDYAEVVENSHWQVFHGLTYIDGWKIGGVPIDRQFGRPELDAPRGWTYIAQLSSLMPTRGVPYPLVNREDPVSRKDFESLRVGWGNVVISVFVDGDGVAHGRESCT